jgi:hypothetical protein
MNTDSGTVRTSDPHTSQPAASAEGGPSVPALRSPRSASAGATAFAVGGFITALGYLIVPSDARHAWIIPAAACVLVGVVAILVGLPVFQRTQTPGRLGAAGAVSLGVGIAMADLPLGVLGTFSRRSLYDTDAYHASALGAVQFFGLPLIGIGVILLLVADARARTEPRWTVWVLLAILVISALCLALPGVASAVRYPAEDFALVGVLGLACRRGTSFVSNPARNRRP